MIIKRYSKMKFVGAVFGCLFAIISGALALPSASVYAEPVNGAITETITTEETVDTDLDTGELWDVDGESNSTDNRTNTDNKPNDTEQTEGQSCQEGMGALGWLVCPATGKIAEAVDWLYDKIEDILIINPVEMKDGSPIYEIWKYMRGITNIGFIIFLLVMVYSQITGLGISNYGLKKTLPKLIVGAILVNLSFIICSLAVDASNIVGSGLRDVFTTIEQNTMGGMNVDPVSMSEMYTALGGGAAGGLLAGVVAIETGTIWMLIPTVLGAIVAVAVGLITIALRQAVVALLIMIAPLAVLAYILPNTEQWFRKWKDLLFKMLIFYPMFSLLFGASSLAGFAIIASANNGFGICLGIAVQIFPLFFSWSLMKMSGTFLSGINAKLSSFAARPLAANRAWAESRRDLTKSRNLALAKKDVYTPSLRLSQFLSDRKIAREEEISEHLNTVKKRGQYYAVKSHYADGEKMTKLNREGETAFEEMTRGLKYDRIVMRHKNNFNEGVGGMGKDRRQTARLKALDSEIVRQSDMLKMETARGELIDYRNAGYFQERMEDAINAHSDLEHEFVYNEKTKRMERNANYRMHNIDKRMAAIDRYNDAAMIMGGTDKLADIQYAGAYATYAYDTQLKAYVTKMQKYYEMLPPTKDLEYRLGEITQDKDAIKLIDAIIPGLRILNFRGDTDIVRKQMRNFLNNVDKNGGLELGTHASQALANFLMTEVKDNDPWLRRFGKYINLETAHVYNHNERQKKTVDYDEYVKGYYYEPGVEKTKDNRTYTKKNMKVLMEGTPLDNIERTAIDNYVDSLMEAYSDENGVMSDENYQEFKEKFEEVNNAILPQLISAMRKNLSGSEQLVNMVKLVTGYGRKPDGHGGDKLESIFADEKDGRNKLRDRFGSNIGDYKKVRDDFAKKYLKSLLPSQVLSMRTDELVAYDKLLPEWFEGENEELHKDLERALAEKHSDWSEEDRAKLLRKVENREMFRKCIPTGVLEQINKTNMKRGVLDSKPMLRDFLGLDGDNGYGKIGLSKYLEDKKGAARVSASDDAEDPEVERIMKELEVIYRQQNETASSDEVSDDYKAKGAYSDEEILEFYEQVKKMKDAREKDHDVLKFYKETLGYISEKTPTIREVYEKYYDDNEDTITVSELFEKLVQLIDGLNG